jgi:dipeptidyl aminopeptidase/acylaminoacyl peptidase
MQRGFYTYVSDGFVVIASQYRGNDGGEGREEYGGADVHDVLNLIPLAKALGYVDLDNVFLLGWSRGAMMTFLALKHGIRVNAAAIGGGLIDLMSEGARRPGLMEVWRELIPEFESRKDERLRERSAIYWASEINVPVLLLSGGADWRADPANTLAFARKLQEIGQPYELIVYAGDDHGITLNRADSDRRILEWFRRYMKGTKAK